MRAVQRAGNVWVWACLIAILLAGGVSAQADAMPHVDVGRRVPRACDVDDIRCLALQRDVCDPWNVTSDQCTFVQVDEYCMEDVNRVNYLALFYCNPKAAMIVAGLAWLVVLFLVMTVAAEIFLCPTIAYLADRMGMAPDIAGVTLFAFASGAPDLFTQVAALAAGDHVDIELAVSATFGGGLFIICVVFSTVILAAGNDLTVPDRRAFIRDAAAYLIATLATLGLLAVGRLTAWTGVLLLSGYIVYLGVCLKTRSTAQHGQHGGHFGMGHSGGHYSTNGGAPGALEDGDLDDAELEMVPFTLEVVADPGSPPPGHGAPRTARLPLPSMSPKSSGPAHSPPLSPAHSNAKLRPRSAVALQLQSSSRALSSELPPAAAAPAPLPPSLPASVPETALDGMKIEFQACLRDLPSNLEEMLHLHGKTGVRRLWAYFTAPVVIFMHATMPAVTPGSYSMAYASILAVCAPPFFLFAASVGPHVLGAGGFATVWLSSSVVLITLAYSVHPTDTPARADPAFLIPASPTGDSDTTAAAVPFSGPVPAALLSPRGSGIFTALRPRRCLFFALLSFAQCILWLNATAEEVVSIFEAIGRIWNVRRDTLGATVLAWGETVPDLVAVLSLARAGQGTMAIAAVFGGPVFNLLVSMGGPILIAGNKSKDGSIAYQLTSGVLVLVGATVATLVALLAVVPGRLRWQLPAKLGAALLAGYAISQLIFLMAEGVVL